jgi:hypothetical protein
MRTLAFALVFALAATTVPLRAQQVVSTKAGLINLQIGEVSLNDAGIEEKKSRFTQMKTGDVLRTAEGRAEVLLAPGTILRLNENSALRLEADSIVNTRVALLDGDAMLEVMEFAKDSSLEILIGADKVSVQKVGLYRLNAAAPEVRVLAGELAVVTGDVLRKVGEGRFMTLTGERLVAKFDRKTGDEFSRWASRRSSHIAMANVSAAKQVRDLGSSWRQSGWVFNQWYGLYTFVPFSGGFFSPWGHSFFTPNSVWSLFQPAPVFVGSGGRGDWSPGFGSSASAGGFGVNTSRGGYSGGGYNGGMGGTGAVSSAPSPAPSVGGAERASGGAAAGGARGGGGGGGNGN